MSQFIEIEKTYLVKYIPTELSLLKSKITRDIYLPETEKPTIRLRKSGEKYEMTKKTQVRDGDASQYIEHTIPLSQEEFDMFATISGRSVEKTRYYYPYNDLTLEVDVFSGDLFGLVLVDAEFSDVDSCNRFDLPDFCLVDITQEGFIAGKNLAGKGIKDIQSDLDRLDYVLIV